MFAVYSVRCARLHDFGRIRFLARFFFAAFRSFVRLLTMEITKTTDVSMYYQALMFAYIIILPFLTMKSFAGGEAHAHEAASMTSPVGLLSIVAAKPSRRSRSSFCTIAVTPALLHTAVPYAEFNVGRAFGCMIRGDLRRNKASSPSASSFPPLSRRISLRRGLGYDRRAACAHGGYRFRIRSLIDFTR